MKLARIAAPAGAILMLGGAVLLWSQADGGRADANAPAAAAAPAAAPEAGPYPTEDIPALEEEFEPALLAAPPPPREKTREEKRFDRVDRNRDGWISQAEFLAQRKRNFDRLDRNGDGVLSFEEYAIEGIQRFAEVDRNRDGRLSREEFAATARPRTPTRSARAPAAPSDCVCS